MRVLIFGKGGISGGIREALPGHEVWELAHYECDVTDPVQIPVRIDAYRPDWIVNCAGISDKFDSTLHTMVTNLWGSYNVLKAARNTPVILLGSVAGLHGGPNHPVYSASKAGVISLAQSWAALGKKVYCISPGRVDTPLRERDWPGEDPETRLRPIDVGFVAGDIMAGKYAPGANVVIRKIGLERVDVFEDLPPWRNPPTGL